MVLKCSVFGCKSSLKNTKDVSFFRIPKVNTRFKKEVQDILKKRREAWLVSVRHQNLIGKEDHLRVCSKHFISGKPAAYRHIDDPDWKPSINVGTINHILSPVSRLKRYQRKIYRESQQQKQVELELPKSPPVCHDNSINVETIQNNDTAVVSETDLSSSLLKMYERDSVDCNKELYELREKVRRLTFADESCLTDKKKCLFYTGLPSVEVIKLLQSRIDEALSCIKVNGLNNFQKLLLTLMKMRNNTTYRGLAYRFNIRIDRVSMCFKKVIVLLEYAFRYIIHWPERDCLRTVMPSTFYKLFGNSVAVIIDCFEIKTQKPSNLKAKAQTFSNYKQNNTDKYLIGITPQGHVSFVSDSYGGRTSDKYITEDCGILDNLLPGDIVLADRGFTIHELVGSRYSELKIPAFLRGQEQLHPEEVEKTRKIATVRIHVERVIGNLRNKFKILNGPVPINLLRYKHENRTIMDCIVRVCCILNNLCESVIPLDEPKKVNENVTFMTSSLNK